MKKIIVLLVMAWSLLPLLHAAEGSKQHLSQKEFKAKQQAYIVEKAGLNPTEVAQFFPIYFELQAKKKQLNDQSWSLIRKGKGADTTEAEYNNILETVYDNSIESDRLEKLYFEQFKKVLTAKKIYLIQRAEMRFRRELLKGAHQKEGPKKRGK